KPHLTLVLPDGLCAARCYGEITFSQAAGKGPFLPYEFFVDGPGSFPFPGGGILAVECVRPPDDLKCLPAATACFDLDAAPFPWFVRTFKPGDRFSPL